MLAALAVISAERGKARALSGRTRTVWDVTIYPQITGFLLDLNTTKNAGGFHSVERAAGSYVAILSP